MKAPKYEIADILCVAIDAAAPLLRYPIRAIDVHEYAVDFFAGNQKVTVNCTYRNSETEQGAPMPGSGNWMAARTSVRASTIWTDIANVVRHAMAFRFFQFRPYRPRADMLRAVFIQAANQLDEPIKQIEVHNGSFEVTDGKRTVVLESFFDDSWHGGPPGQGKGAWNARVVDIQLADKRASRSI
jgi:hypothetical protein